MKTPAPRPLRALAALMTVYIGGRIAVATQYPEFAAFGLQPADELLAARAEPVRSDAGRAPVATAAMRAASVGDFRLFPFNLTAARSPPRAALIVRADQDRPAMRAPVRHASSSARPAAPQHLLAEDMRWLPAPMSTPFGNATSPALSGVAAPALPVMRERGRALSGSAWLLLRDGSRGASLAPGGTLGGSQAGVRVNWRPAAAPVFLTVRASAALAARDSEIAPGIGLRGKAAGVILEQRFRLESGRSSQTALVAYGGVDGVEAPFGFRLDGYAQAGAVGVSHPALFVDGAARAERTVAQFGRARLGFGAAVWGAAQPGVSRVDIGPQAVLHLPLSPAGVRLSAEYRFRVAGNAKPADGLSVTLGADF